MKTSARAAPQSYSPGSVVPRFAETSIAEQHLLPAGYYRPMLTAEDAEEGPRAFVEKRPPSWKEH